MKVVLSKLCAKSQTEIESQTQAQPQKLGKFCRKGQKSVQKTPNRQCAKKTQVLPVIFLKLYRDFLGKFSNFFSNLILKFLSKIYLRKPKNKPTISFLYQENFKENPKANTKTTEEILDEYYLTCYLIKNNN